MLPSKLSDLKQLKTTEFFNRAPPDSKCTQFIKNLVNSSPSPSSSNISAPTTMPTICFNLTKADKKSKKKDSSPFLASEMEPPVVMSADVNIPAAYAHPSHPLSNSL
ncbi:hypothetical protein MHU86_8030 [Fragilaria crotonensis]|nr:hypothetical protein MHU86_8030 [Fragilaria crotonensis]